MEEKVFTGAQDIPTVRQLLNSVNVSTLKALADNSDVFDGGRVEQILKEVVGLPQDTNPNIFIITEYTDVFGRYAVNGTLAKEGDVAKGVYYADMTTLSPSDYIDAKVISLRGVVGEINRVVLHLLFNILGGIAVDSGGGGT